MKKIFLAIMFLVFGYCAISQNLKENVIPGGTGIPVLAPPDVNNEHAPVTYINNISINAVRHLKKTFKNVDDEKWYEMPDGFRANFILNDIHYRLDYDKDGNWLHTMKYIDEKKLPLEVRRLVVSSYLDYSIRTVQEIEAPHNILFYVIHLEGETNWINIKVLDYEINELDKIKKS
jgi:hypothetical protein